MGSTWQQRGGVLTARGLGSGFGGRSLCLSKQSLPALPIEIAVSVKLDDESGAAGIAFYSDGKNKHYGFYPSNGQMRLTCFKGPNVYSWQILQDVATPHYLPGQWNRLRVRLENKSFKCFVNDHLVITSTDRQLTSGSIGLVKFRDTNPDFRKFEVGSDLKSNPLTSKTKQLLTKVDQRQLPFSEIDDSHLGAFGQSGEASARELRKRAAQMEKEASTLRQLADEVRRVEVVKKLSELFSSKESNQERLLAGTLLVAQLDNPDIDREHYRQRIDAMSEEIKAALPEEADGTSKLVALNNYLFRQNGFHGGRSEYYHPANSHLNRVIDDREGLPITLSILYMEIGRRIGLNILGVGLPGHFVVRHEPSDDADEHQLIDVYEGGEALTLNEAGTRVMQYAGRRLTNEDLRSQSDREIVTRVLSNLMSIASRKEDIESMLRYLDASVAVNPDAVDFRVMRAQLRGMTGRRKRAITDVDYLLESNTPGIDRRRLQQLRSAIENQN
jgi:regulator of sirC expression with transglutaminase-like and TPR domain